MTFYETVTFDSVCNNLCDIKTEIIKFSFAEIFKLLEKNPNKLAILILLEVFKKPLMIRQISDILDLDENKIRDAIPSLLNFQCIERISAGRDEKYIVNDEVRMFTRGLSQKHKNISNDLHRRIVQNYTLEKQFDYTAEEKEIVNIFDKYLSEENYLEAENFLIDQLKNKPHSGLIKYHYAKYVKEQKRELGKALDILKSLSQEHLKHPNILRLIISCYVSYDAPNYDSAKKYVNELEEYSNFSDDIKIEIAEFYLRWSISTKLKGWALDPIQEISRKSQYKDLANVALNFLKGVNDKEKGHKFYYLHSYALFNIWDNYGAIKSIDKAIELAGNDVTYLQSYRKLRKRIVRIIHKPKAFRAYTAKKGRF